MPSARSSRQSSIDLVLATESTMNRLSDFEFDDDSKAHWSKRSGEHLVSTDITGADNMPSPREVLEEIAWILIGALTVALAGSLSLHFGFSGIV
jgi:hypothetical protein